MIEHNHTRLPVNSAQPATAIIAATRICPPFLSPHWAGKVQGRFRHNHDRASDDDSTTTTWIGSLDEMAILVPLRRAH